jgi:hypothetical protein
MPTIVSTNDILALSFGIASTVIGVATALITYIRRAPEGISLNNFSIHLYKANVGSVPENVETHVTTNNGHNVASHIPDPIPSAINDELAVYDFDMILSSYDGTGERAGASHLSNTVDEGPPSYTHLPSPANNTGVAPCIAERLPGYPHLEVSAQDFKTPFSDISKPGPAYHHSSPSSPEDIEA